LAFTLSANVDAQGHQGFLRHFRKHKSAPVPPPIDWTNPKITNYNGLGRQWDPMVVWPGGFVSNLYVNVGNSYAAGYNCTGSYLYYGNMGGTEPAQTDLCIKNTLALTEKDAQGCRHDQPGVHVTTYQPGSRSSIINDGTRLLMFQSWDVLSIDPSVLPYDWRHDPNTLGKCTNFDQQAVAQIESFYYANRRQPVRMQAHSCGPAYMNQFLARQPQWWKDKFIAGAVILDDDFTGETDMFLITGPIYGLVGQGVVIVATPEYDQFLLNSFDILPYFSPDFDLYKNVPAVIFLDGTPNIYYNQLGPLYLAGGYSQSFVDSLNNKNKTYPCPGVKELGCFAGYNDDIYPESLIYNSGVGFNLFSVPDDMTGGKGDSGQNLPTNIEGCKRAMTCPGAQAPTLVPFNHTPTLEGSLASWKLIFNRYIKAQAYAVDLSTAS
jgi:hypothetical protein